ncbi:isopentenyl-diphosphate delta-isomerase [Candidatus Marsarchaeota G2 archaeon ECH_B_SAG-F08]|jgi:isopentenyl-diphosphate delta-isomerase, type 1|uniref:isopentenyl-diphosphate Delta-isomerase n=6 Tax=Candidatus Marsarchaeota TaxID=1978152 RepID=A0A2R6AE60_9ARCH|nr:MAG: isopentenyl-diphosphate delta-isomerase [Candidatus Marsarchaeota G1 archaeon OSP_D]PSN84665.1 MAG: isopentenyl-diphosphate delta-isomerase [Candidatus Marsarchaeota G1 archaeon BE_D]PSN87367.1 MAG: isopentenyl-diphosphate delta-isomerase [Candidatus Marsarchaeota G1 archaeon OSP_C]PSN89405.1 MAG: isopentenyl-diphosphate delta-isomerase [Candidatus Marsarchaeota G1 archaeon OSP_B]PSN99820.1 MAG: isopentenyl-diphosphate delta-isomerase [Candidatus Marsarchaeota G2 archaeon ECH_B_SAG-F08]
MVVLVDENDREIGVLEKHEAHRRGRLHRAFSVFIFNSRGETLLQKRAQDKYHSGGLWTNACDGHPRPGEGVIQAALRRLKDELGFECELKEVGQMIYKEPVSNGMTEHEFLHVLVGLYDGEVKPDPNEAAEVKWISLEELRKEVNKNPENYAVWTRLVLQRFKF